LKSTRSIDSQIKNAEKELANLNRRKIQLENEIKHLRNLQHSIAEKTSSFNHKIKPGITSDSPEDQKINLFRSLFRGREDVFPKRYESKRTGKSGYQPVCRNEWIRPLCQKPKIKCGECENRDFEPVTNDVVRNHLLGFDPNDRYKRECVIGLYPMLADETCWFLAVDFDKEQWMKDISAYLETCRTFKVPASVEISRSGKGGHIWIFFSEPITAKLARQLGAFMLTQAMEKRPEMGFESYDRFFPSQDTLPKGGFGNLIALPLQKKPRERGNTLFVDEPFNPYLDQWAFLTTVSRMSLVDVQSIVDKSFKSGGVLGVKFVSTEEDEGAPWLNSPSGKRPEFEIVGTLPDKVELVLSNQIFIPKKGLPPALKNKLIRLAAFQNPDFYKSQAMRFPTYDKPRIVHCCEDFPEHIGLPRGCLEDAVELLASLNIETNISDKRFMGNMLDVNFLGDLHPEQKDAAQAILAHDSGVLSAATAFGKTVVAAYLIAARSVNTIVLVHRKQLLDQWILRLKTFLDIPDESIGQIGGGKRKPTGIIDVATIQSLSRKGVVDDVVADYGYLIVDECHHISARSFEIVARQSKAKYITGLSATIIRKDGHHPIIFMNCGPVRHKVDDKKQAAKRPFEHKVNVIKTPYRFPSSIDLKGYSAIHQIYEFLINNDDRNRQIVKDISKSISESRFPVVLTERKEHLEKLKLLLEEKIENIIVMRGGMGVKQRRETMRALENLPDSAERVILATGKYLGEGFDDERLDTLFLTLPISWRGTLAQYAGRLHRTHYSKKEVIIYDYVDAAVPMLARMFQRRLTGYRAIGYEVLE